LGSKGRKLKWNLPSLALGKGLIGIRELNPFLNLPPITLIFLGLPKVEGG